MRHRAAALLALLVLACREQPAPSQAEVPTGPKPELALLTSLPLVFAEGFKLDSPPHPAIEQLERHFHVKPVDGPETLPEQGLLLAVQPQALTAERLVALDGWIRRGGRMLLLADPQFSWESERSLGDALRPPFSFPDTGLLAHWGLRLSGPQESGPVIRRLEGSEVLAGSPGTLSALPGSPCEIGHQGFVARCRLGSGRAMVIADADFVQAEVPGGVDGLTANNHPALLAAVHKLQR